MVVDGNFNAVEVAASAFAERAGAPHAHPAAVAQLAVEGFDYPGARFAHDVSPGGQHPRIGSPSVGEVACVAAVTLRQRGPQPGERRGTSTT